MPGLRKRLTSEGITPLQFGFQLVVVLLGVYLAILFESKAEDRSRQAEALAMLGNVLGELELDEDELGRVIQRDREIHDAFVHLQDLLTAASEAEEAAVDSLLVSLTYLDTPFLRGSAFAALVSSGDIGFIPETDLVLRLANLYEHQYDRLRNHGRLMDDTVQDSFWLPTRTTFWDFRYRRFLNRGEEANAVFWNLADGQRRQAANYLNRLEETLGEITAAKESLAAYLN